MVRWPPPKQTPTDTRTLKYFSLAYKCGNCFVLQYPTVCVQSFVPLVPCGKRDQCAASYFHRPPICILTVSTLFEIKTHALQRKNLYFRWLLSTKCSPGPSHSSLVFDHRPDPRCGGPFPRMRPCKPSQLLSLTESFQIARLFGATLLPSARSSQKPPNPRLQANTRLSAGSRLGSSHVQWPIKQSLLPNSLRGTKSGGHPEDKTFFNFDFVCRAAAHSGHRKWNAEHNVGNIYRRKMKKWRWHHCWTKETKS